MFWKIRFNAIALLSLLVLVSTSAAIAGQRQLYAKGVRVCNSTVKANHSTCFAMKRVFVKAGTPGAKPYRPAGAGTPNAATAGPSGGLTPADLWAAYHLTSSATGGTGQTVAIVDAFSDPKIEEDLATFSSQYGLAACTTASGCFKIVNQNGATSPLPAGNSSWAAEESIDVEVVHAICQGCKIVLVEATTNSDSDLAIAENTAANTIHANEISNSFGRPETPNPTFQAAFNHPGIVITASSGDDGYYSWDKLTSGGINVPNIPASYGTVVAVGGTGLYMNNAGTRESEVVWNDNGPEGVYLFAMGQTFGASGGGCSTLIAAPGWQTHMANWSGTACGSKRLDTDVSAVGDPLSGFDIRDSLGCSGLCWFSYGGTSVSAPIIAAIYALAGGAHGVPYPSITLYGHLGSAYDVTAGGNGYCDGVSTPQCTTYGGNAFGINPNLAGYGLIDCAWNAAGTTQVDSRACNAAVGYDGASGVGAPNGMTMFTKTGPNFVISGGTAAKHLVSHSWSAKSITDPFPGGLVNTSTGCSWSWGDGTSSLNTSCTKAHTYSSAGKKSITLTVKDNYGVTTAKLLKLTVS